MAEFMKKCEVIYSVILLFLFFILGALCVMCLSHDQCFRFILNELFWVSLGHSMGDSLIWLGCFYFRDTF